MADTEVRQSELFEPVMTVIYTIALVIGAVSLVLLAVPVAVDVFLRHAGSYFPGAFEIQELMMGTLAVSGMIVVSCRDRHIAIDFLYQLLNGL